MKVPSSEPTMTDMPPMDMMPQDMTANNMGGFPNQQNMDNLPQMDGGIGQESEFDTNFDAGVEADEEQDPKKYIQQLTGKLSQTLRKYNEDNGQPDVDLNKYVVGMIAKQGTEGLTKDDTDEILNKIKSDENFNINDETEDIQQTQMNGEQENMISPQNIQSNESRQNIGKEKIDEIVNSVLHDINNKPYQEMNTKKSFKTKPFTSPKFDKK